MTGLDRWVEIYKKLSLPIASTISFIGAVVLIAQDRLTSASALGLIFFRDTGFYQSASFRELQIARNGREAKTDD